MFDIYFAKVIKKRKLLSKYSIFYQKYKKYPISIKKTINAKVNLSSVFILNNMTNKNIFRTKNRIFGTVFAHKCEDT